jgi:glutathione S-transferase
MSDAYLRLNPNALIPTIEDDGPGGNIVLWESNAILRYMAARHAPDRFWPTDPAQRAIGDKWMDWQFAFADAQRDAFLNLVRRKSGDRDAAAISASAGMTGAMMRILDDSLALSPWLSGTDFGLGDIPMGVYAHTWFTLDIERPSFAYVAAWYEKLKTRPGYADTVMIPLT